jgi:hypothetical protein
MWGITFSSLAVTELCYGWTALAGQGLLLIEVSRLHLDAPHSLEPLWTSDRPVAGTST